jgi:hypothetical protein
MRAAAASLLVLSILRAQAPPAPQPPAVSETAPPSAAAPAAKPLLENSGKPMRVAVECGDNEILTHGLVCSSEAPCPVYLELSSLEVGVKMFVAGNLHTDTATLSSILMASDDGGKSWYEPHERIRSAGLEQMQFVDLEHGWIAGQLLQAMPRDPFFLLTTDGGKTWRRRPVFAETRVGAIGQFWFENKNNGWLLIDRTRASETGVRHESYETMAGGENWTVRELSDRPIKLKGARVPNPDWRLRADAATKSYRVEKRQGEKWLPVASFLIAAGDCKPQDRPLEEPPPPPEPVETVEPPPTRGPSPKRPPPSLKKPGQ